MIGLNLDTQTNARTFVVWGLGSALLLVRSVWIKEWSTAWMFGIYLATDLIGVYRWWEYL